MKTAKSNLRRFKACTITLVCILLAVVSIAPAYAAATNDYECLAASKTITVTTAASGSPYIVFNAEGGTTKNAVYGIGNPAPKMSLKIYNRKTGETYYMQVTGTGMYISSKLSLNKSTAYTVTVSYLYDKNVNWGYLVRAGGSVYGWYNGTWRVSSTNALTSFSIK